MKCTIPEISWHNREPIFSVDIHPKEENKEFYRLASGGGDCHVLIWQLNINSNGAVNQELISDLTRHQKAINCVRWSISGKFLASGDDDANIIIWNLKTDNIPLLEEDNNDKEVWNVYKVLRGHKEDVYDLSWSLDDAKLLSGSVDNTAILWDIHKGKIDNILTDHKGFVQGVAWDPKNRIIATLSTDRICRIYNTTGKQIIARIQKGKIHSLAETHPLNDKEVKFFHDDTFKSFFRRLEFTPDGSLLIVPSGYLEMSNSNKFFANSTLIFTLTNLQSPSVILPLPNHTNSTVVRCCPTLFELKTSGPDPIIKLPYRMIFAIGTDRDIILYDTQQIYPIARFQDMHYTRLTDLAWSKNGLILIASSTDGFCSLITFELNELGEEWNATESIIEEKREIEQVIPEKHEIEELPEKEIIIKKRPGFLEAWTSSTPKKRKEQAQKVETNVIIEIPDSPVKTIISGDEKPKKRITPILIESAKSFASKISCENVKSSENEKSSRKASQEITNFFCRVPKLGSVKNNSVNDAKPIAIRRKPREVLENSILKENAAKELYVLLKKDNVWKNSSGISLGKSDNNELGFNFSNSKFTETTVDSGINSTEDKKENKTNIFAEDTVAKDSWSCDKVEFKMETKNHIFEINDDTEEFSLGLDESPVKTVKNNTDEQNKQEINKDSQKMEVNKSIKPHRRIPLITLSSPGSKISKK